ncbi:Txe/YoeB family addiction module toxin [Spirosoma utsteinense]|uniref:Putative mRNA interferase YoeB n=1 Tax=Spirosoma utsteinense TaxID=2585773 RepID=A0ABR6W1U2_9BACT|nr:Txe/YoeB family addiction module toxin [Spirosoma utsteinense]MBC3786506.1 toxin YoeB [Spirosoma utsteinense]MBC3789882.1 toxin YoeB [Spirosoma utsteinense]
MHRLTFENEAFDEFTEWATHDKKLFIRIVKLLAEIRRTPFDGTGKPEALKHDYKGCWSRRIDQEHRLIYKVTDETILVLSCRDHY